MARLVYHWGLQHVFLEGPFGGIRARCSRCRWVWPRRAAARAGLRQLRPARRSLRHQQRGGRAGVPGRDAVRRGRRRRSPEAGPRITAGRHDRPGRRCERRERDRGHRHPGRRAPQPRSQRGVAGGGPDRPLPERRPVARAAIDPVPRHDGPGRDHGGRPRKVDRGGVLSRTDRRRKSDDRALRAPSDRVRPAAVGPRPRREAVRQPGVADGPHAARGGRARQAVHQHLALHPFRDRQPALHDGERLRVGLRADTRRGSPTTIPGQAISPAPALRLVHVSSRTRCSLPPSTTTTSCSATPPCW